MADGFAWGSALGASVALWLAYGAFYVLIGVATTALLRRPAVRPLGFVSPDADAAYLGESPAVLFARVPGARKLRDAAVLALAALMTAAGVLVVAVAWFGLRRAEPWALGALAAAGLVVLPPYALLLAPYARAGAPLGPGHVPPFIWVPGLLLVPAAVLGWAGLR